MNVAYGHLFFAAWEFNNGRRPSRSNEDIARSAAKYRTRAEFAQGDAGGYTLAKKRKIIDDICGHMERGGGVWNKERCLEEARKHSNRWALGKANKACYNRISVMGWEEEAYAHMQPPKNFTLTKEDCIAEARKYKTPSEFSHGSQGHYLAARRTVGKKLSHTSNMPGHTTMRSRRKNLQPNVELGLSSRIGIRRHVIGLGARDCLTSYAHLEKPGNVYLRVLRNTEDAR